MRRGLRALAGLVLFLGLPLAGGVAAIAISASCSSPGEAHHYGILGPTSSNGSTSVDVTQPYGLSPGADKTGATDSSTAIQHYLGVGGNLWVPSGTYRIKAALSFSLNGTRLIGAGWASTTFLIDDSSGNIGDLFTLDAIRNCELSGFSISAVTTRTAGTAIVVKGGDATVALPPAGADFNRAAQHKIDVDMDKQFNGMKILDHSTTNGAWMVNVGSKARQGLWRDFKAGTTTGGTGIIINSPQGGNHNVTDVFFINDPSTPNKAMVQIVGSGGTLLDGVNGLGAFNEVLINPGTGDVGSSSVMYIGMNNCLFDFGGGGDTILWDTSHGYLGARIIGEMSNMWIASGINGIHLIGLNAGGGTLTFQGGHIDSESGYGILGEAGTTPSSVLLGGTVPTSGTTCAASCAPISFFGCVLGNAHFQ